MDTNDLKPSIESSPKVKVKKTQKQNVTRARKGRPIVPVETDEIRQQREKQRLYHRRKRANETPEQREKRLKILRESAKKYKAKKKLARASNSTKDTDCMKQLQSNDTEQTQNNSTEEPLNNCLDENGQYSTEFKLTKEHEEKVNNLCYICFIAFDICDPGLEISQDIVEILSLVNVTINLNPAYSSRICGECWKSLRTAFDTLQTVENASKFWDQYLIQLKEVDRRIKLEAERLRKEQEEADNYLESFPEPDQDDSSDNDDTWAFEPEIDFSAVPRKRPKKKKQDYETEKWSGYINTIDPLVEIKKTGKSSLTFEVPKDDDGTSDFYEYDWLCRLCNLGFDTKEIILEHAKTVHNVTEKRSIHLKIVGHRTAKDTDNIYCVKCWTEYKDLEELNTHRAQCRVPLSNQRFSNGFKRRFQCCKCLNFYSNKTCLRIHFERICYATEESCNKYKQVYTCQDCGKGFRTPVGLKYHRNAVHEQERLLFYCPKCNKGLTTSFSLERHVLRCNPTRPEPEKKFQCPECQNFFPTKTVLNVHLTSQHNGIPAHACRFCEKSFHAWSGRMKHETIHHVFNYPLRCKICEKNYFLLDELKKHGENKHRIFGNEEFEEKILVRIPFADRQDLLNAALCRYECHRCAEAFSTPENLKQHEDFTCNVYGVVDNDHLRQFCTACGEGFLVKDRLAWHVKYFCKEIKACM